MSFSKASVIPHAPRNELSISTFIFAFYSSIEIHSWKFISDIL